MNTLHNFIPGRACKLSLPSRRGQSGAILVVALIMLLIITSIGISSLNSTNLEVQMAANAQFKNIIFQESEHVIEETVSDLDVLGSAYSASLASTAPVWPTSTVTTASSGNHYLSGESETKFVGFSSPKGESSGSIRIGASGYSLYHFEVRGTADVANSGASNTNVRGAYIVGARPGS
jgi:type IV pilus assembly protein PilX